MRVGTREAIQKVRQARDFFADTQMAALLGTTKPVVELDAALDRLLAHTVEQDLKNRAIGSSVVGSLELARTLRSDLMRPIARLARSLFPDDAELRRALVMPKSKDYERLITAAQAMATTAEANKARFIDAGFKEDFIETLRKGAADLRAARDEKGTHFGKRVGATAGQINEVARCKDLIRLLDDLVQPALRGTPDRLAEWRALSRFTRTRRVAEAVTPPPASAAVGSNPVAGTLSSGTTAGAPIAILSTSSAPEEGTKDAKAA